jgi:hypothetical protein
MKTYSHTQRAGRWLWLPAGMALILLLMTVWLRLWPLLGGIGVLALAMWLFGSLTIELAGGVLKWRLGPGLIRRSLPVDLIAEARAVRTRWIDGWGIHYTRLGWLYNVAGFDAVAITLKNGKQFALGTDEPDRLLTALNLGSAHL